MRDEVSHWVAERTAAATEGEEEDVDEEEEDGKKGEKCEAA